MKIIYSLPYAVYVHIYNSGKIMVNHGRVGSVLNPRPENKDDGDFEAILLEQYPTFHSAQTGTKRWRKFYS